MACRSDGTGTLYSEGCIAFRGWERPHQWWAMPTLLPKDHPRARGPRGKPRARGELLEPCQSAKLLIGRLKLRLIGALGLGLDVQRARRPGLDALDGIRPDGHVPAEDSALVNHQPGGLEVAFVAR